MQIDLRWKPVTIQAFRSQYPTFRIWNQLKTQAVFSILSKLFFSIRALFIRYIRFCENYLRNLPVFGSMKKVTGMTLKGITLFNGNLISDPRIFWLRQSRIHQKRIQYLAFQAYLSLKNAQPPPAIFYQTPDTKKGGLFGRFGLLR